MSNSIDENILIKCPDLYNDVNKALWINNALLYIHSECYGEKYTLAVALRACHDYTVNQIQSGIGTGTSGIITSKREGDQAITFANIQAQTNDDSYLTQTIYGKELLSLQRGTLPRINNTGITVLTTNCN